MMVLHYTINVLSGHDALKCWSHFATIRLVSVKENTDTLKMAEPRDRKDLATDDDITGPQN